jgi:hypothetical protein
MKGSVVTVLSSPQHFDANKYFQNKELWLLIIALEMYAFDIAFLIKKLLWGSEGSHLLFILDDQELLMRDYFC